MVQVSKTVKDQMVEMKLLKVEKGRTQGLYVANRTHKSKAKTYYVVDDIYKLYLRRISNQSK